MRRASRIVVGGSVLGLAALALSGCLLGTETVGSGESACTWRGNKLTRICRADYEKVWAAASVAVRDLGLFVGSERHDSLVGRIEARRADDVDVRVMLENIGEGRVRVVVQVGFFGGERDRQSAMVVMDAIAKKLGG